MGEITKDDIIAKFNLEKERDSVIQAEISKKNYAYLIKEVKKRLMGKKLDIIIGGPPCQAYSMIGRSRDVNGMKGDKRNFLYKYYIKFLIGLKPKVFIFENVPGLKTAGGGKYLEDMEILMSEAGYYTKYKILNAADYGVPQNRKRIILVGWDKNLNITEYPDFGEVSRNYLVKDFLSDLPAIKHGYSMKSRKYKSKSKFLKKVGIQYPFLFEH